MNICRNLVAFDADPLNRGRADDLDRGHGENRRGAGGGRVVPRIMNTSINQVLSRTAMTSLTTLLGALALFLMGGEVLHDFGFSLVIGILVGTYSSWFVASPIIYEWRTRVEAARRAKR